MARRKHPTPQAKFAFTAPRTAATEANRSNVRPSVLRSHAAYWGGPMRKVRSHSETQPQKEKLHDDKDTRPFAENCLSPCSELSMLPTPAPGVDLSTASTTDTVGIMSDTAVAGLFGRDFLEKIAVSSGQEGLGLLNGYVLVTTAYSMAISGNGDKKAFLHLKEHLLRCVLQDMQERKGRASLRAMGTMMLLGSPIVCLLSQGLPGGLPIKEYLAACADGGRVCCTDSASIAKDSLREKDVHWRALKEMIRRDQHLHWRISQLDWLRYLSRYLEM